MVMSNTDTSYSANAEDAWEQPTTSIIDLSRRVVPQSTTPVPDDWDADENEEQPDARELWETANTRIPMPEIQLSTTSSSTSVPLPPPAAFEAPLRILKRPSSTSSKSPSPMTGTQTQKSFKEREAQYQAARERIFGEDVSGMDKDSSGSGRPKMALDSPRSNITRDPLGPASVGDQEASQGFLARRKKGVRAETVASTLEDGEVKGDDHHADT